VTFIGHSHLTKSFALTWEGAEDVSAPVIHVKADRKYIVTVGSVGQPRDYDNRSCCAVFDTETARLEYIRLDYEVEAAAKKIFDSRLASNFGKRLFLGI